MIFMMCFLSWKLSGDISSILLYANFSTVAMNFKFRFSEIWWKPRKSSHEQFFLANPIYLSIYEAFDYEGTKRNCTENLFKYTYLNTNLHYFIFFAKWKEIFIFFSEIIIIIMIITLFKILSRLWRNFQMQFNEQ